MLVGVSLPINVQTLTLEIDSTKQNVFLPGVFFSQAQVLPVFFAPQFLFGHISQHN